RIIGCGEPSNLAEPASARNSRCLENQATTIDASIPNTTSQTITARQYPIPTPRWLLLRHTTESTRHPTTLARNTTKVLTTPCISVRVTISPLATWATSWPKTAVTSSSFIVSSRPVETATKASFLNAPVANALGAPSYIATSG